MSAPYDPMTFDELSELYRVEMKNPSLTEVRKDLYRAMANLLTSLRQEYDRQMSIDPDSVMTEGAELRRKKADRLCKDVAVLRTRKIAGMAIRTAEGARTQVDTLTDDERGYYDEVLALTREQLSTIDRHRGRRSYVPTRLDGTTVPEEPAPEPPRPAPEPTVPKKEASPVSPEPEPYEEEPFDEPAEEEPFEDDIPDDEPPIVDLPPAPAPEPPKEVPHPEPVPESSGGQVLIRVLEDLPPFVSAERDYRLSKEDLVTLPKVLADILIGGGKAMAVAPTP